MRNQPLTGFVLHQKPYRENRSITYFFSKEYGLVNGIGKKNLPLFLPLSVFATGKTELKNFSQSQLVQNSQLMPLNGQAMFAGLYLNEILVKILSVEEPCEPLWQAYQQSLLNLATLKLATPDTQHDVMLKILLRQFEHALFSDLGYAIDFTQDSFGELINANQYYRHQLQTGFVPIIVAENTGKGQGVDIFLGKDLLLWQGWVNVNQHSQILANFSPDDNILLNQMGKLYRTLIDNLLNYQPLQSRELWRELAKYQ